MTLEEFKTEVETFFDVDLTVKSRLYDVVKVRFLYYHYARHYTPVITTYHKIGKSVGFDHATVLYGSREYKNILASDCFFQKDVVLFDNYIFPKFDESKRKVEEYKTKRSREMRKMTIKKQIRSLEKEYETLELHGNG